MLNIAECDVDENERPKRPHKIINTKVLKHPFDDLVVRYVLTKNLIYQLFFRNKTTDKKKNKDKKKETKKVETKKLNLLSFGDEAEEDEEEVAKINQVFFHQFFYSIFQF